jgi:Domain of unknown function (DUF4249)
MNKYCLYILLLVLISACTERMDEEFIEQISKDNQIQRIVADGTITTDTMVHQIKLSYSKPYFSSNDLEMLSGAEVFIENEDTSLYLTENLDNPGFYETSPTFYGVENKNYTLRIRLDTDNDNISDEEIIASDSMPSIHYMDSIDTRYHEIWDGWEVLVYALDPPTEDYYIFKVYKNDTLTSDSITEWAIQDDFFFNGNYTNGVSSQFLQDKYPDEHTEIGDTIKFELNAISKEYFYFLFELLDETVWGNDPMFSGPPANISTNLKSTTGKTECAGFFNCASIHRLTNIVD